MDVLSWFEGRQAILATMHQKEKAIAPLLTEKLGLEIIVADDFNTDIFGTFTRDIKRVSNQLATARLKAEAALNVTGANIAIASEGAFIPHPSFPYISCDREIVFLLDRENKLEIIGEEISLETNYNSCEITTIEEALIFAVKIGFPEHGLIVMPDANIRDNNYIFKGIIIEEKLIELVAKLLSQFPTVHLETDMRAMHNPTRMAVIKKATLNLIKKAQQLCRNCNFPGFDVIKQTKGLSCSLCGFPTPEIRSEIYQCQKCNFQEEKLFPYGEFADPGKCEYCNP